MNLKDIFPKASSSFLNANADVFPDRPTNVPTDKQNDSSAILERKQMNATERGYSLLLEALRRRGEIEDWKFESVKLRISTRCFYTPDFFIERRNQKPFFAEVKGPFIREDARVKFLAAKELHRWADFEMHQRDQNGWRRIL
jgi:hypothetical protein